MTREEKITEIAKLMTEGVLTADEFSKIVQLLNGESAAGTLEEKTPAELKYEDYIVNNVAYAFKSPASVKFPPLEKSMIKKGKLKIKYAPTDFHYIETYIDAANSFGALLRHEIVIVVDDELNPQYAMQREMGLFGILTDNWVKIERAR